MVNKIFRKLTLIETVGMFTTMLALFIDTNLTGIFLDNNALSASAICMPVVFFVATLGGTLSVGAKVLCSKAIGENSISQNNSVFSSIMTAAFVASVPLTIIVELFAPQITALLGVEPGTAQFIEACNYMRGYTIGTPFFTFILCLTSFAIMSEKSNYVVYSNIALVVVDVVFDLLNVTIFHQGMLGMGLASSVSHLAAMVVVMIPFFKPDFPFSYRLSATKISVILEAFKQGVNYAMRHISKSTKSYIINQLLIASAVQNSLSIYALVSSYANVFTTVGSAMGKTTLALSKVYATSKDKTRLKALFDRSILDSILLNSIPVVVILMLPKLILRISLRPGSNIFDPTAKALMIFIISIIPFAMNRCLISFYQGLGKLKLSFFLSLMHNFFGPISALLLVVSVRLDNIWWFYLIQEIIVLGCIAGYVVLTQRPFINNSNPFMLLNSVENCIDIVLSVRTSETIPETCGIIRNFMEQNGADLLQKQKASEFLQHYLGLVADSGKPRAHTEVRVLKKGQGFSLVIENDDFKKDTNPFGDAAPSSQSDYKENIRIDKVLSLNRVSFDV